MTGAAGEAGVGTALGTSDAARPMAWGVAGLLLAVSDTLAARFASVTVRGELISFTRAASGHCYFTLKDLGGGAAGLRCAMFRRAAQMLNFAAADGQQVELRGRLAVYEARGELQLVVESMQRLGAGTLYEEFLRLKERLAAQGLFALERKRPLPAHPRRLALVTSAAGAALHDVLSTFARRAPQVELVLCASPVQGAEAPAALVAALALANSVPQAEAVLLCRGGGSLEDLWAFNDERVVRAVAGSRLPVICGVGHETDVTLADLAADLRAPTPTAAAELASPPRDALLSDLQSRGRRLEERLTRRLEGEALRLDHLGLRLRQPAQRLGRESQRLDSLRDRHGAALQRSLQAQGQRLDQRAQRLVQAGRTSLAAPSHHLAMQGSRLASLDPRQVLQRGYAWVENDAGRALVSARGLSPGQALRAVWADGQAQVRVDSVRLDDPPEPPSA